MSDLLSWLEDQKQFPKVYWQDRETKQIQAACGETHHLHSIPIQPDRLYFGGISFNDSYSDIKKTTLWNDFPSCYFFAPLTLRTETSTCDCNMQNYGAITQRIDTPNLLKWKQLVEQALLKIKRKEMDKVVLARCTTLLYADLLNPFDIIRNLQAKVVYATLFLFQLSPDLTFIGATPEKLYTRHGVNIIAEAVAGTCSISDEKRLLTDEKEVREFAFVKQFIQAELSPFCSSYAWEAQDRILSTIGVQHLYNRFTATLKTVSDEHLIRLLHPTPAMAGYPRHLALNHLAKEESIDRGWYAAPIGWIGPNHADIAIGIRSALVHKKEMHLFAGAGIVEQSRPEKEWEELNLKLRSFI